MRPTSPVRTAAAVALLVSAALLGVLAPQAAAQPTYSAQPAPALPLPLPGAGAGSEPLLTEAVNIEGPLLNNLTLPTLR